VLTMILEVVNQLSLQNFMQILF